MPIGSRAKSASLAIALLVMALVVMPVLATGQPQVVIDAVTPYAKPSTKPKPSHPHATPTPAPTPTPRPTAAPTPKVTPKPAPTTAPDATPRRTERPGKGDATPKPSKRPSRSAAPSDVLQPSSTDGRILAPGSASIGGVGPSPELLGVATFSAAVVGLGFLWFVTGRRRRRPAQPSPAVAAARPPAPARERWTNVTLDDNDALPTWLRAVAEPERAPYDLGRPMFSAAPDPAAAPLAAVTEQPEEWDPAPEMAPALDVPQRPPVTFTEPMADGVMRLALGGQPAELYGQPDDFSVVLTTLVPGDEVEIQDIEEPWIRVLTPMGATGWIRSASLGFGGAPAGGDAAGSDAAGGPPVQPAADGATTLDEPAGPDRKRGPLGTRRRSRSARSAT